MKAFFKRVDALFAIVFCFVANSFLLLERSALWLLLVLPLFFAVNLLAGFFAGGARGVRLRVCYHGGMLLLIFSISMIFSLVFHTVTAHIFFPSEWRSFMWSAVFSIAAHALLLWNGVLCVYVTSVQLGVRLRVLGGILSAIPFFNLALLVRVIETVFAEVQFESEKIRVNEARKKDKICRTKYPILMVHGLFFRDYRYFNYWGRIPEELKRNGALVFYGEHQSALSVADSAVEIKARVEEIRAMTGCEKVNIIAHSKGGLDCRYAISELGMGPMVASLTTVSTPHNGCLFVDHLLEKMPKKVRNGIVKTYNATLKRLGDESPDFLAAVRDLTGDACGKRNASLKDPEGIPCRSIGSVVFKARGAKFPMNLSHRFVHRFDGPNDGLVSESSFAWSEDCCVLYPSGERGISHGDMIDLNRENIEGFDVREFYVQLVAELKMNGL